MTSLAQELRELKSQLQFVEEIRSVWEQEEEWELGMTALVNDTKSRLVDLFGKSLHVLDTFNPDVSSLEKVLKKFPESLGVENEKRTLPIHSVASEYKLACSVLYIPLLAREGSKHKIGGDGSRGGLLGRRREGNSLDTRNCLQNLSSIRNDRYEMWRDPYCVEVFEELKRDRLLVKEDIFDYDLIFWSAGEGTIDRFKFFLKWDPDAIENYSKKHGTHLMHHCAMGSFYDFRGVLEFMLEYNPHEAGFLFQKDEEGITVFEKFYDRFNEKDVMSLINQAIYESLSPKCSFPILHHALVAVPKYRDLFQKWFPWAYNLKDHNDRSLTQAILAAGNECIEKNISVFASMSDDQIRTKDPVTTLYPFATVASGGDLQKCFYLLRRHPCVLDPWSTEVRRPRRSTKGKKRKRSPSPSS
ncbi:hypothetical protein CTEN210_02981 [Chaetoceros tenuissimus]|uniref:Uncharacterized protein n=1 Tax=Chaetoceros tenuissimus TaxID=426638 RepID=A0AAD3CI41_9STRA|nr:hypothetical protein CTEN210_02981 [Chaetoceros tenuissimus]